MSGSSNSLCERSLVVWCPIVCAALMGSSPRHSNNIFPLILFIGLCFLSVWWLTEWLVSYTFFFQKQRPSLIIYMYARRLNIWIYTRVDWTVSYIYFFQKQRPLLIIYLYARRLNIWRKKRTKMADLMGIRTLVLGYTVHQQKNVTLQHQYIVYKLLRNTLIIWPPSPLHVEFRTGQQGSQCQKRWRWDVITQHHQPTVHFCHLFWYGLRVNLSNF